MVNQMSGQPNKLYLPFIVYTIFHIISPHISAQDNSNSIVLKQRKRDIHSIQLSFHSGFIFAQSKEVAYSKGSHPYGIEASMGWLKNDSSVTNICNCYPRQGISIAYFNLNNPVYGKSFSASYFFEPSYRIGTKSFFYIRGHLGGAYLTDPYDSILNPGNRAYSSRMNFFLSLGVGLKFTVGNKWGINSGINLQHISNAGTRIPNAGINWPTLYAAISRQNKPLPAKILSYKDKSWKNEPVRWELSLFGIASKVITKNNHKRLYPILGAGFRGSKQVSSLNALIMGIEIIDDKRTWFKMTKDSIYKSPIRIGLLGGNEFLLGKFYFSQCLGVYLYNHTLNPRFFHRWAIQYKFNKDFGAGFSFLAHGKTADFFDIKTSYSF